MKLFSKDKFFAAAAFLAIFSIATYCGGEKKSEEGASAGASAEATAGKDLFMNNGCAGCHGETGMGDGPAGMSLNPKPRNFHATAEYKQGTSAAEIAATIEKGVPGTPMAAYPQISEADRMSIAAYIVSMQK